MKRDHDKRLETLEAREQSQTVDAIEVLGVSTCRRVEHTGGILWNIATREQTEIPAPPCPLGEDCTCRGEQGAYPK
jgi:hypothetical protein